MRCAAGADAVEAKMSCRSLGDKGISKVRIALSSIAERALIMLNKVFVSMPFWKLPIPCTAAATAIAATSFHY